MTIIAMTREMGTLGKEVAREFAARMDYKVVHYELSDNGTDRTRRAMESEVFRFLEGSSEEQDHWQGGDTGGYMTREEIFETALAGRAIIRGWGAARLLRSIPNVLSVRVGAPMEFRIRQIVDRLDVSEQVARREIERSDGLHRNVFQRFFDADWTDPLNYDLILNTGHMAVSGCTDILVSAAQNPAFSETEESRSQLKDRLIEARILGSLGADADLARRCSNVHVAVDGERVRLYGLVTDGETRKEAERIAAAHCSQKGLQNEIAQASRFD